MGVADCVNLSPKDPEMRRSCAEGGVYDHVIQPTDSSELASEPWLSSSSSSSSIFHAGSDYSVHAYYQTSHQCRCCVHSLSQPRNHRDHDDNPSSRRRHLGDHSSETRIPASSSSMTSSCTNTDDSQSRAGRCRRKVTSPFLWPCVARAVFLFVVLMSCLGVNLARPASGLSEHEKHYRDLQSRAVVSSSQSIAARARLAVVCRRRGARAIYSWH